MKNKIRAIGLFGFVLLLSSCIKDGPSPASGLVPFDAAHKIMADKVISCFENDDQTIQYGYIENLNDGRGYTAGRAGFTTGTGDLLIVVQLYTDTIPGNSLAQYLPILQNLAASQSSSVAGLENLPSNWQQSALDPVFRFVQDFVNDSFYYQPVVQYAQELGITYPLTLLCMYDACIQHGDGDDPDGLSAMIDCATKKAGGSPSEGTEEAKWLYEFNRVREKTLKHPDNKDTKEEWRESVGRVKALDDLRKSGKFLLDEASVEVNPYGTNHVIVL
jgi:chitosanase